jgi:hypothetical protein
MIALPSALKVFFDDYRASFLQGPAAIAEFYYEPCITARQGVVAVNSSHQDTTNLFARVDEQYRSRGFTHADYEPLDVKLLGANGALATIGGLTKIRTGKRSGGPRFPTISTSETAFGKFWCRRCTIEGGVKRRMKATDRYTVGQFQKNHMRINGSSCVPLRS